MSSTKSSALFFGFLLSGPTTVEAVVLAPSVVTLYSSGYDATEELPRGSRASSSVQVVATTFTLTERAMISSITAQAIYYGELNSPPPNDDQFHITFYSDTAGSFPASPLGSPLVTTDFIRFDTSSELSFGFQEDFPIFEFEILLDEPQSLAAGSYWISITNFTPESPEVRWSWIFTSEDPEDPRYASGVPPFIDPTLMRVC